jgi:hypothetical protein
VGDWWVRVRVLDDGERAQKLAAETKPPSGLSGKTGLEFSGRPLLTISGSSVIVSARVNEPGDQTLVTKQ